MTREELLSSVKYDSNGLVCAVVQDAHAKKVRMVAYMNEEALKRTLETKQMTYYSRSRQKLWIKGEESGHFQNMLGVSIDCDGDCLLFQIEQVGGVSCHTGNQTCFYRDLKEEGLFVNNREKSVESDVELINLEKTVRSRIDNPVAGSYTNYLIDKGENKILKKIGEEASEFIIASKDGNKNEIIGEIADLVFHSTILMQLHDISWNDIFDELKKR